MEIRRTVPEDMEEILSIYESARAFMREQGNTSQWGHNYPPLALVEKDIRVGRSYVCVHEGQIAAVFVFVIGEDSTYCRIDNGSWLNEEEYGVVHRIASAGVVRGAVSYSLDWCFERCGNLRIDTHEDNVPMRKLLEKKGFANCGTIYVRDNSPRVAYQKHR